MRNLPRLSTWVLASLTWTGTVFAQSSMEGAVSELTTEAAKRYISPVVSGFGANMNAGWYHKAPPAKKFGFTLEGGWLFMATFLDQSGKTFDVQGDFRFSQDQATQMLSFMDTQEPYASMPTTQRQALKDSLAVRLASEDFRVGFGGPTITGSSNDSVRVRFQGKTFNVSGYPDSIAIPADTVALPVTGLLEDVPAMPLVSPQITLGTVFGTNLTFRYLPPVDLTSEIGEFNFFGFGIQHNPQVWLGSPLPVDVSLGFFTQKLELGKLFEASTLALGVNVSKQFGWRLFNVTPYGGFALEKSTMEFHYDLTLETPTGVRVQPVKFELKGDNNTRTTLGLSLHLLILNLNADYNFAKYPSMSIGLMLGI